MKCCVQFLVILAQPSSGCLFGLIGKRDRDWVRWRERDRDRETDTENKRLREKSERLRERETERLTCFTSNMLIWRESFSLT